MGEANILPRFSRIDFFACQEDGFIHALSSAMRSHFQENPGFLPTEKQLALRAWSALAVDVPNGGFTQFFFNHGGDSGIEPLCGLLDSFGQPDLVSLLSQAGLIYRQYRDQFQVENPWKGLFGSIKEFDALDSAFSDLDLGKPNGAIYRWARANIRELAVGDDGKPIDSSFTGTVEIDDPKGFVRERLEVTNGAADGPYAEFFEDGSLRTFSLFKAGKFIGNCWPNGQLKSKKSAHASSNLVEWFYPSGKLQKRMVLDESDEYIEPIQLFHENGQLAEEMEMRDGKKFGYWRKFFEDGSPRLQAEFIEDREPVIHNAWDSGRNQVVKDGSGVFDDSEPSIEWKHDVFFKSRGFQNISELKNGIRHGQTTTYDRDGVLWNVTMYKNGVPMGRSISYWDNGRIRSITHYKGGEVSKQRSFAKFDDPKPAVVLELEANESLYIAWRHMPIDQYPIAQNLAEIRGQLKIPQFLQKIYGQNIAGSVEGKYEDWNTFDDGIAYFIQVDAAGSVISASANGSGVCSMGEWNTYLPLLKQLCFTPGRLRGRAVECQVLARVDHTFIEGESNPLQGSLNGIRRWFHHLLLPSPAPPTRTRRSSSPAFPPR